MIKELLGELDESVPGLGFVCYEESLLNVGFSCVHQVTDTLDIQQSFDQLVIPATLRQEIFEHTARMTHRVEKLKQTTKTENPQI